MNKPRTRIPTSLVVKEAYVGVNERHLMIGASFLNDDILGGSTGAAHEADSTSNSSVNAVSEGEEGVTSQADAL